MSGEVPEGWASDKFINLVTLKRGYDLPVTDRIDGSFLVVASNGPVGTHNIPAVSGPVIVTGRSGTIGKVELYWEDCHPLNTTLYSQNLHGNDPRYVAEYIRFFRLERFATGTGVPTLNRNLVHAETIVIPPLPEQKRIAEILSSVDESIRATEAVIAQAERVKRGLMEDLLTGGLGSAAIANGEVPEGWEIVTFDKIVLSMDGGVSVNSQNTPTSSGEKGVLKTSAVSNGFFNINENKVVAEPHEIKRLKEPVQSETIIFSRMNTPQLVGANAYVTEDRPDLFLPDRLWAIKPDTKKVIARWLGFWMHYQFETRMFEALGTGTSGSMKNISKQKLNSVSVCLPSRDQQQTAVEVLRAVSDQITTNRATAEQLQRLKRGMMDDLLTGKVRTVA